MSRIIYPLKKDEPRTLSARSTHGTHKGKVVSKPLGNFFTQPISFMRALFIRMGVLKPNAGLAIIVSVAVISSQAALIYNARVGLFASVLCFMLLMVLALMREAARPLLISLAVLPVANIVSSSFITHTTLTRTTIFYVTLLVLAPLYRYLFSLDAPLTSTKLTARGYAFALPAMVVAGQILGLIGYAFLRHQFNYNHVSLIVVTLLSIVFAFCEEVFMRGLIQQQAAKLFHPVVAAMLAAGMYIILSFRNQSLLTLGPAIFMGVALAYTYYKKQNLILTVTMNAAAKLTYVGLLATFILK